MTKGNGRSVIPRKGIAPLRADRCTSGDLILEQQFHASFEVKLVRAPYEKVNPHACICILQIHALIDSMSLELLASLRKG